MKRLVFLLGVALMICACGDDGKLKLYESCSSGAQCTQDLVCLKGECTRSCSVTSSSYSVGDCPASSDCVEDATGCCLLTVVTEGTGKGNCTVNPPVN